MFIRQGFLADHGPTWHLDALNAEYALAVDNELVPVEGYRSANYGIALAACPELRMCLFDWSPLAQRQLQGELVLRPPRCWSRRSMAVCGGEAVSGIAVPSLG
jgi:hypothetical protein